MRKRISIVGLCLLLAGCVTEQETRYESPGSGEPMEVDPSPTPRDSGRSVEEILREVAREESADDEPATLEEAMALLDDRPEWQTYPPIERGYLVRHPAEQHLKGMRFVLDPGHGGDAAKENWKEGPTGVREAEMNLRVAKLLQKLLVDAGAEVHLTRDRDNDLSLADRAKLGNDLEVDFFIGLHHNAVGNPESNYGSVWYHGGVNEAGPELDLARHVGLALGRHMRTQVARSSPIFSDSQMYNSGFGVLRSTRVPAILLESSFYTNPAEEQRLRDALYNLREAYAIYEGLCEYVYLGTPTQEMTLRPATPDEVRESLSNLSITFEFGPLTAAQLFDAALADRVPGPEQASVIDLSNLRLRIESVTREGEAPAEPGPAAGASTRATTGPTTATADPTTTTAPTRTPGGRPLGQPLMLSGTLDTGLPEWWGYEKGRLVAPSVNLFADGEEVAIELDETTGEFSAMLPADTETVRIYHENLFGHRNFPQWFAIDSANSTMTPLPAPRSGNENPPAPANQATPGERADADRQWLALPKKSVPILLHEGGDTKAQAVIDAIELPEGSAMTVAGIDPAGGDIYALRWRNTGQVGFYPASTVKLATALMTLKQLHNLAPEAKLADWQVQLEGDELTGEEAKSVKTLLRDMIADSSNEAFNTLQEVAGFAETQEFLQSLGMEQLIIRRHFTRPHWNNSRPATITLEGGQAFDIPARPSPDLPKNAAGGESNRASTDDFVRLLAATFMTDARKLPGFDVLAEAMRNTNEPFVKNGLDRVGEEGEGFVVFNKPGWYPLDGVHADAAYVYDTTTGRHYFVAIYYQGPEVEESEENLKGPRNEMAEAVRKVFSAIREGSIRL